MFLKFKTAAGWIGASLLGATLIVSTAGLALTARFGSLAAGLAYLRGQYLVVLPQTLDVGSGQENEKRAYRLELLNLSNRPLTVLGAKSSCGCIVVKDKLPLEIAARGSAWLSGTVTFIGQSDDLRHAITVYSDLPQGGTASTEVKGHIRREASTQN